jgi:hypothetical protein
MLEQLTEKLKAKGCHFLADIEFSDNSEWISELFLKPSSVRTQLLSWCISKLEPDMEKINNDETLKVLGVCSSSESTSFSSAIMSRNRQLKIWSHLIDLLGAHDDGDCTEDGRLKLSSSAAFIDALAENVSFDYTSKLDVFPVHFERELKQILSLPSDSQLSATLVRGKEAHRELERFAEAEMANTETDREILRSVEAAASEVVGRSEELSVKHQAEFSCWIQNQHQQPLSPADSREDPILRAEQTLRSVERVLSNCVTIAQSTNHVLELGERDLREFNNLSLSLMSGMDSSVGLTDSTDHNMSRAPAAS